MTTSLYYIAATFLFISLAIVVVEFVTTFRAYRDSRTIICPGDYRTAAIQVDALHAALPTAIGKSPDLRVKHCSKWPEREGCGQTCLAQIERTLAS